MQTSKAVIITLDDGDELIIRYKNSSVNIDTASEEHGELVVTIEVPHIGITALTRSQKPDGTSSPKIDVTSCTTAVIEFGEVQEIDGSTDMLFPDSNETISCLSYFKKY